MKIDTVESQVLYALQNQSGISFGATIIVGLSGGPDSVFLLHMLRKIQKKLELSIIIVHINHEWRAESEKEAQFCHKLATESGLPIEIRKLSEVSVVIKFNGSREEYARKVRRYFFEDIAERYQADAIVLAHHADDQQETFFIRLLRGASVTGLAGMRIRHGLYVRPLLGIAKKDILMYLHQHDIAYCVDQTNVSDQYLRNRIRNKVIPVLQQVDARASVSIDRTIAQLQKTEEYLYEHTQSIWSAIAHQKDERWYVSSSMLMSLHNVMRQRLFMYWFNTESVSYVPTQKFFAEIERFLLNTKSDKHAIHVAWSLHKHKNVVYIVHIDDK